MINQRSQNRFNSFLRSIPPNKLLKQLIDSRTLLPPELKSRDSGMVYLTILNRNEI